MEDKRRLATHPLSRRDASPESPAPCPAAFLHTSLLSMPSTATQTLDTLCSRPSWQREQPTKGWILQYLDLAAGR